MRMSKLREITRRSGSRRTEEDVVVRQLQRTWRANLSFLVAIAEQLIPLQRKGKKRTFLMNRYGGIYLLIYDNK